MPGQIRSPIGSPVATTTAAGLMSADMVGTLHPMSSFPSYGKSRGLFIGYGCADYLGAAGSQQGPFSRSASGTGAGSGGLVGEANAPGIEGFTTGTTTTGLSSSFTAGSGFLTSQGALYWRGRFRVPTASDVTDTFGVFAGFSFGVSSLATTRMAGFRYQYNVNSGLLECVNRNAASEAGSVYNSTINPVMASGFLDLELKLDLANNLVTYVNNGATVTTIAVNVPSGLVGAGIYILKSAGITSRTIEIDAQGVVQDGITR